MSDQSTDLAVHEERPNTIAVPSDAEWNRMLQMADRLAQAGMVPRQYQRRPADVLVALVAGRELGMGVMAAMQRIHVIEGKPTLSSEAMVALVLRAGHELVVEESTATKCTVKGRRIGSNEWQRSTFTIEEAKQAGVAGKDNWKKYPAAMLRARAISALCRFAFADVLLGYTYTPDEVGAVTDANDNIIEAEVVEKDDNTPPFIVNLRTSGATDDLITLVARKMVEQAKVDKTIDGIEDLYEMPMPWRQALDAEVRKVLAEKERNPNAAPSEDVSTRSDEMDEVTDAEVVIEHPCPVCGHECDRRSKKKDDGKVIKWWQCTNWGCTGGDEGKAWTSFHNDPWKPGGQIETEFGSKSAPTESVDDSQPPVESSASHPPAEQESVEAGTLSGTAPSLLDGQPADEN